MKAIFKSALVLCAALTAGLVGCSKEDSGKPVNNEGGNSIFVKMFESSIGTRADGPEVVDETAIDVTSAEIYFTNAAGDIVDHVTVATGNAAYDDDAKTVGMETAKAGFKVENLPASVTKVSILGNYDNGTELTSGNVTQMIDQVADQFDATGKGIAKVSLYGEAVLAKTAITTDEENEYEAEVTVYPIGARLEITKIAGDAPNADPADEFVIKSFTLEGIYINNYLPTMNVNGLVAPATTNNGSDASKYTATAYATNADALVDEFTTLEDALTYTPTEDVWGYNTLATSTAYAPAVTDNVPHVIIKLSNVVVSDGTTDDDQTYKGTKWLTVRNFYDSAAPTTKLTELQQGYVYSFEAAIGDGLHFNKRDLTDLPELGTINATVKATLIDWTAVTVGYDFE